MGRPVLHWQILSKDPQQSASFYAELFGWSIDADNPLGYRKVDTNTSEGIGGGIWPCPPEGHEFVQLFVGVDDVAAAVERATELGGRVVMPPQALPEGGEMAVLQDPRGLPFVVHRPA